MPKSYISKANMLINIPAIFKWVILFILYALNQQKRDMAPNAPSPPPKKTHIYGEFYLIMIRVNTYVESDKGKEIERESAIKHISKYLIQKSPIMFFMHS